MPKGSYRAKSKAKKGEKKHQQARRPIPVAPKRIAPRSTATSASPIQPIVAYPYVPSELKRIGIIAGGILLLLIILSLVL